MALKKLRNDGVGMPYCGPTAVALITGKPVSKVLDTFRLEMHPRKRRPPPIKGVHTHDILMVLKRLGWKVVEHTRPSVTTGTGANLRFKRITLAAWLRRRKPHEMNATYLVSLKSHVIVVKGRKTADNGNGGEPTFIGKSPHRRKYVERVYRVEKI